MSDPISPILDSDLVATEGNLYAIQAKVLEYLNEIEVFQPVELKFMEDSKTIEDDINKALGQLGMAMMVSIGGSDDKASSVPGLIILDPLDIIISVFENPTLNRATGITCNRAIEIIAVTLKLKQVGSGFLTRPKLRLVDDDSMKGIIAKAVTFRMSATL